LVILFVVEDFEILKLSKIFIKKMSLGDYIFLRFVVGFFRIYCFIWVFIVHSFLGIFESIFWKIYYSYYYYYWVRVTVDFFYKSVYLEIFSWKGVLAAKASFLNLCYNVFIFPFVFVDNVLNVFTFLVVNTVFFLYFFFRMVFVFFFYFFFNYFFFFFFL